MAWTDYEKAYDLVPHSWIIECLDLFGVAENIKSLLLNSTEKWKVMLCSGNSELSEVDIKQDIFQGYSLSLLVLKGKIVKSLGIELPDGKVIKSLQEGESYRYLGILEADTFLKDEVECFEGIY